MIQEDKKKKGQDISSLERKPSFFSGKHSEAASGQV